MRTVWLVPVLVALAGCSAVPPVSLPSLSWPSVSLPTWQGGEAGYARPLRLTFQNGQQARVVFTNRAAGQAVMAWAGQGLYTQAPVYKQLPGVFLLVGKPRLAGYAGEAGIPSAGLPTSGGAGTASLVVHADGTAGPELLLQYGRAYVSCCEAPASVTVGYLEEADALATVQRGDVLSEATPQ